MTPRPDPKAEKIIRYQKDVPRGKLEAEAQKYALASARARRKTKR